MKAARDSTSGLPFQGMGARQWTNLLIAGLALFWLAQIALDIAWGNVFGRFASDAASFWSAGYIANHYGYAGVYDLELMAQAQHPLLPEIPNSPFTFHPIPTPYLPIFLLPFQLLALVPPIPAAIAWILGNAIGTVLYIRAFVRRATGQPPGPRTLALLLISAPVFLNLFTGQVNLLLMVGMGEFLLASEQGKPLHAGLWLGLLLIKPQSLVLLVPALLLQREFRTLLGLVLSSALVAGVSFALAGPEAFLGPGRLWLDYAAGAGLPTNDVSLMMNWRMVGLALGGLVPAGLAGTIVIGGSVLTMAAALALWARPLKIGSLRYRSSLLGLLAATCALAWHSHVHAAIILLPVLLLLHAEHKDLVGNLLEWWALMPTTLYLVRLVLASMLHAGLLPNQVSLLLDFLAGVGLFIMNLVMLGWAVRLSRSPLKSQY